MAKTKILICPYCGEMQPVGERCVACGGLFEPLSRQASHNAMGPWFVRNPMRPFQPGCSYETLVRMVERGQVIKTSIVRGPTSKQFWTAARRLPGIAHLLGYCHNCDASVDPGDHGCHSCGVPFGAYLDRNYLGLPEVKPLPWEAPVLDEQGGMRSQSAHGIDWQRAAEPMGLSSFASDRDLRGGGGQFVPAAGSGLLSNVAGTGGGGAMSAGRMAAAGASASVMGLDRPDPGASMFTSSAAAVESATSSAVSRSLQRRVDEQQRTIRTLIMVMIALTVISVIIVVMRFSGSGSSGGLAPTRTAATKPAATLEPPASAPAVETPASAPEVEFADDLRRVNQLMEVAARSDRAVGDRIKDYEDAQALLRSIVARVPKSQQPRDLDAKLRKIEQEISQLKLKQYFP